MHLLTTSSTGLDEIVEAVDLGQSPGDIAILSFADSDLTGLAAAWEAERAALPRVRLAQHPVRGQARFAENARIYHDHVGHSHERRQSAQEFALNRRLVFGKVKDAVEQAILSGKSRGLRLRHRERIRLPPLYAK